MAFKIALGNLNLNTENSQKIIYGEIFL